MTEKTKDDALVRWQTATAAQLTGATNLVFTTTIAALGFQVAQIQAASIKVASWWSLSGPIAAVFYLLSAGVGLGLVLNRLSAFRATARVVRMRMNSDPDLPDARKRVSRRDKWTWRFLWAQIVLFGFGIICTAVGAIVENAAKFALSTSTSS